MLEFIQYGFGAILLIAVMYFAYMSSVLISEKKDRQRKGLTDYYDMPIKKESNETIS